MVLMFLTNWKLIFIIVNFFHFLPISWATWFCNVWLLTSHWEKTKSIYAVSLNQAKHCRKHQKSWGQPKSWEVVLPNQLSRIHNHRTYFWVLFTLSIVWVKTNDNNNCPFYNHFWPFFCQLYVYLSQKGGSDGHFEVLNGSKYWLVQKILPQM